MQKFLKSLFITIRNVFIPLTNDPPKIEVIGETIWNTSSGRVKVVFVLYEGIIKGFIGNDFCGSNRGVKMIIRDDKGLLEPEISKAIYAIRIDSKKSEELNFS